jgi:hypothetical protein
MTDLHIYRQRAGGKFHLHYVTKATVKHGASSRINGGYAFDPQRIDAETVSTEAPNVFERQGAVTYLTQTELKTIAAYWKLDLPK